MGEPPDVGGSQPRVLGAWLLVSPALPLLPIVIYAASDDVGDVSCWSAFAVAVMTVAAALSVGGILGFLFALPRTVQQEQGSALLATNSNLDQVSDWLTKILIGLGLIELGTIADEVDNLGESVASALGNGTGAETFALSILIYSAIDGFLLGYLWTRIVVSRGLKEAAENLAKVTEFNEALERPLRAPPPDPEPPASVEPPGSGEPQRGDGPMGGEAEA